MKKITIKQYEKAKSIVLQYELQLKKSVVKKIFTKDDLEIYSGSISVPTLTPAIVDEDFAAFLEEQLSQIGHSIDYVSLDDMGYISIHFRGIYDVVITDKHISDVLSILNKQP